MPNALADYPNDPTAKGPRISLWSFYPFPVGQRVFIEQSNCPKSPDCIPDRRLPSFNPFKRLKSLWYQILGPEAKIIGSSQLRTVPYPQCGFISESNVPQRNEARNELPYSLQTSVHRGRQPRRAYPSDTTDHELQWLSNTDNAVWKTLAAYGETHKYKDALVPRPTDTTRLVRERPHLDCQSLICSTPR
jgi:hypothetical protein